ncbi:GNAT family N-acetyltransferase [Embleya sp. NBC_00896]|uniref:GNAT family N-acetyltransferase n=1 Tax=Embleya sp. NBC_00896 TaxID=2975961 RepID=UPI003864718A|nr:GNAT family N-acetyltransferase [Embleya sp. NBC_00896]
MIREATAADIPAIHALVRELAEYEKCLHEVKSTEAQLHTALFGPTPAAFAFIAEDDTSGEVVGFALWFLNFSTWEGVHGIYLEDLYVRPEARGGGHGSALLKRLAQVCTERGYARLQWAVLDWNEPSIGFYDSLGATQESDWIGYRLTGTPLTRLAGN